LKSLSRVGIVDVTVIIRLDPLLNKQHNSFIKY